MNSLGLSGISTSLGSDMNHGFVFYRFHTIVLLLVIDLASLRPCTVQMSDIHFCGVLPPHMWYIKQLLICTYFCFGLAQMLNYSNPPSSLRWMDPFVDFHFLPVVGLPAEPLHVSQIFVVAMGILSVVVVN
jgi:hypothetical protein